LPESTDFRPFAFFHQAEQRSDGRQPVVNLEIPRSDTRTATDASSRNTGLTRAASQIGGGGGGSVTDGPDAFGPTWKPLKIGAGGFLTGKSVRAAQLYNSGVYEIQVAPSNSSTLCIVYFMYKASTLPAIVRVCKSTNKGANWTQTSLTPVQGPTVNANGPYRPWGPKNGN
jgi:hypothetical protein